VNSIRWLYETLEDFVVLMAVFRTLGTIGTALGSTMTSSSATYPSPLMRSSLSLILRFSSQPDSTMIPPLYFLAIVVRLRFDV
jgi:hypothetical protein